MQASKFELVINNQTAHMLGLEVPASLLAPADAQTFGEFVLGACNLFRLSAGPAKAPAHNPPCCEVPIALDLGLDGSEAGVSRAAGSSRLELGEPARHVEEELAARPTPEAATQSSA